MVDLTRREINLTEVDCVLQWIACEMDVTLHLVVLLSAFLCCNGVSIRKQLEHIARRWQENQGIGSVNTRRRYNMEEQGSVILGAPSFPNHLPEAEPILPGHTLLRPALGMLKSAVKFPHKEMENGAGVYGNINNLGIRYDGRNERLMYSGFRRTSTDLVESSEEETHKQLRKKSPKNTNTVKRILKIFPAKLINKRIITSYRQNGNGMQHRLEPRFYYNNKKKQRLQKNNNFNQKNHLMVIPEPSQIDYNDMEFDPTQPKLDSWLNQGLYGRYNQNIKRTLTSRLHTSDKTMLFLKKMLQNASNSKRRQDNIIKIDPQGKIRDDNNLGMSLPPQDISESEEVTEPSEDQAKKHTWYWKSKDAFNHIIFNPDAPDHEEHLPSESMDENDLRHWWYYHQADFQPFNEVDD